MNPYRFALANLRFPATPEESVALAEQAIQQAAIDRSRIVCPGMLHPPPGVGKPVRPPDSAFLDRARSAIAQARSPIRDHRGPKELKRITLARPPRVPLQT